MREFRQGGGKEGGMEEVGGIEGWGNKNQVIIQDKNIFDKMINDGKIINT